MCATSVISCNCPKANNHPLGENLPNLVTQIATCKEMPVIPDKKVVDKKRKFVKRRAEEEATQTMVG
jgi:hypothetical protein